MLASSGAFLAGSDKPEKPTVKVGFIPLTDCASVVMASVLGFDEKYGIKIVLSKEASWSAVRDRLCSGDLDAAHVLYGLVYGVQTGIGARQQAMAVLMGLSQNGQSITVSRALAERGGVDGPSLARLLHGERRDWTFAQTFPTGNHAMWLYYWLAAHGIDPLHDARMVTVPPAQMVANLDAGHMDGFCAGEPWGNRAVMDGVGITVATSQQVWPDHPGKVLGATASFAARHPNTCRALVAAILDASRWLDASRGNKELAAEVLASPAYVNTGRQVIGQRLLGHYQDGLGNSWDDLRPLRFHADGAVNFPWLSDGMWFMTQHRRWGLLQHDPDYLVVARAVNRVALYAEAAALAGVRVPDALMRDSILVDGVRWDGTDPAAYAASFKIGHRG